MLVLVLVLVVSMVFVLAKVLAAAAALVAASAKKIDFKSQYEEPTSSRQVAGGTCSECVPG